MIVFGLFDWFLRAPDNDGGAGGGGGDNGNGGGAADDDDDGGGAAGGDDDDDGNGGGGNANEKPITRKDLDRALTDVQRYKRDARKQREINANLAAEIELLKKGDKGNKGEDFKAKYEAEAQKTRDLQASIVENAKLHALLPALRKAGLADNADKFVERLDLDELEVEYTSTGRIQILNLDEFVDGIRKDYGFAFNKQKAPRTNGGGTGGGNAGSGGGKKEWTPESLYALEKECRKKGNMAQYEAAVQEYRDMVQRKRKQA